MKLTLCQRIIMLTAVAMTLLPIHAQETKKRIKPFVTAGYNYSHFCVNLDGRSSFNAGGGAIIPLFNRGLVGIRPQLLYIQKGDRSHFEVYKKERTVKFDANYLELPVDLVLTGRPLTRRFDISALCGLYFAYGIGGKTTASDGIYLYNRYHVGDSPSTFGDEMNGRRFDWGIRLGTIVRLDRYFFTFVMEPGLKKVMDGRIARYGSSSPMNLAILLNVGIELPTSGKRP
jgi:hypothetical protein